MLHKTGKNDFTRAMTEHSGKGFFITIMPRIFRRSSYCARIRKNCCAPAPVEMVNVNSPPPALVLMAVKFAGASCGKQPRLLYQATGA
jgi:hypothetical protein